MDPLGPYQAVIELGPEPVEQLPGDRRICLWVGIAAGKKAATLGICQVAQVAGRVPMAQFDRPRRRSFELIPHPSTRPSFSRSRRPVPTGATRLANVGEAAPKTPPRGSRRSESGR